MTVTQEEDVDQSVDAVPPAQAQDGLSKKRFISFGDIHPRKHKERVDMEHDTLERYKWREALIHTMSNLKYAVTQKCQITPGQWPELVASGEAEIETVDNRARLQQEDSQNNFADKYVRCGHADICKRSAQR